MQVLARQQGIRIIDHGSTFSYRPQRISWTKRKFSSGFRLSTSPHKIGSDYRSHHFMTTSPISSIVSFIGMSSSLQCRFHLLSSSSLILHLSPACALRNYRIYTLSYLLSSYMDAIILQVFENYCIKSWWCLSLWCYWIISVPGSVIE